MKKFLATVAIIIAVIAVICFIGVYKYTSNVPKLTLKYKTFNAMCGSSCNLSDLVDVKCKGDYALQGYIMDTNISNASVKDEVIYTGDTSRYIHLSIVGVGKRSEGGKPVEAYIFVAFNDEEQEEIRQNAVETYAVIDKYLHEEFFTEANNTDLERSLFTSCYNTENEFGVARDMTEELFSEYIEKFNGAVLTGVIAFYGDEPFTHRDEKIPNTYYALYKTADGKDLYLTVSGTVDRDSNVSLRVKEEAPDSGGSRTYDVEKRSIEISAAGTDLTREYGSVKAGDGFIYYNNFVTVEKYDRDVKAFGEMIFDQVHYFFTVPLP